MNRNLTLSIIHIVLGVAVALYALQGCAGVPVEKNLPDRINPQVMKDVVSACRHQAVFCALLYGERGEKVMIGLGPVNGTKYQKWHGQAYYLNRNNDIVWLVFRGNTCKEGHNENFDLWGSHTVHEFMAWQWPWVK